MPKPDRLDALLREVTSGIRMSDDAAANLFAELVHRVKAVEEENRRLRKIVDTPLPVWVD